MKRAEKKPAVTAWFHAPENSTKRKWRGYDLYEFTFNGLPSLLVPPKKPARGMPWAWRAAFFDAWPETDLALLERGYHVAHTEVADLLGSPKAVRQFDRFYEYLTGTHGLAPRAALIALSRGGLIAYNWAAANPEKVSCIYADAPVCDFKSWPGGKGRAKGNPALWRQVLKLYGLTAAEAMAYKHNPIDNLAPLVRAGIPLLHVCGDADDVVPMEENTNILESRCRALGGEIQVIVKPGVGHHPHSLTDVRPIVAFIEKATKKFRKQDR